VTIAAFHGVAVETGDLVKVVVVKDIRDRAAVIYSERESVWKKRKNAKMSRRRKVWKAASWRMAKENSERAKYPQTISGLI
jgi:hypothetical protein